MRNLAVKMPEDLLPEFGLRVQAAFRAPNAGSSFDDRHLSGGEGQNITKP